MNTDTQNSKASTVYLCYFLAALVMLVTAWLVVVGIQATEPASPARHAKVAAGVLLIMIEGFAFHAASRWNEISGMLRLLGWCVFALQITMMSLAQIATGTTAGKVAALSTATVDEVRAQADESRKNAQVLRESAEKLNKSKHGWLNEQGGQKAAAAAGQTANAEKALDRLDKLQAVAASTPIVQLIGERGLIALSFAISIIFELAGIALMHTAGKLSRRADSQPVDQQILGMLQQMRGEAPATPALPAASVKQTQADEHGSANTPAAPPAFDFGFIPRTPAYASAVEARHDAPKSGELWTAPRREYVLAPSHADAEPQEPASPAPHAVPVPVSVPAKTVPVRVQDTIPERVRQAAPADTPKAEEAVPAPAPKVAKPRARKPRTDAPKVRYDTGTDEDAVRYQSVVTAVRSRQISPSFGAIKKLAGCRQTVAKRFRSTMAERGIIEPDPESPGQYRLKEGKAALDADKSQMQLTGI